MSKEAVGACSGRISLQCGEQGIPRSKKLKRYKSIISGMMHQSTLLTKATSMALSAKDEVESLERRYAGVGSSSAESLAATAFSSTLLMVTD